MRAAPGQSAHATARQLPNNKMKTSFGKIYGKNTPTHAVYAENNLAHWGERTVAISHHWSAAAAEKAAEKETALRGEKCIVVTCEK